MFLPVRTLTASGKSFLIASSRDMAPPVRKDDWKKMTDVINYEMNK